MPSISPWRVRRKRITSRDEGKEDRKVEEGKGKGEGQDEKESTIGSWRYFEELNW